MTRIIPVNLNPQMENPEQRKFKRSNILEDICNNRSKIITALISIIFGCIEGEPIEVNNSRFQYWDQFIRDPLLAVSGIDINEAVLQNKLNDPDFNNQKKLLAALYSANGTREVTSRQIIDENFNPDTGKPNTNVVGEILEEILGNKYTNNAKVLGRLLGKMLGRIYGGLRLTRVETDRSYWQCEKVEENE